MSKFETSSDNFGFVYVHAYKLLNLLMFWFCMFGMLDAYATYKPFKFGKFVAFFATSMPVSFGMFISLQVSYRQVGKLCA